MHPGSGSHQRCQKLWKTREDKDGELNMGSRNTDLDKSSFPRGVAGRA
jgi:hypothetical protein